SLAALVLLFEQYQQGRLLVAAGEVLSRGFASHWGGVFGVYTEWLLVVLSVFGFLFLKHHRVFALIIAVIFSIGLIQHFSNHALYLTLGFFYLGFERSIDLLRLQCLLLYILAGANELSESFMTGDSLRNLFLNMQHQGLHGLLSFPLEYANVLAILAVVMEISIPAALIFFPPLGIAIAVCLHLGFALFMPGLWGFF